MTAHDWREQAKAALEEAMGHGYSSLDNLLNALVDAAAPAIRADERERVAQALDHRYQDIKRQPGHDMNPEYWDGVLDGLDNAEQIARGGAS